MSRRVVYVPTEFLQRFVDLDELRRLDPDVELLTTPWDGFDADVRLAHTRDPFAASLRAEQVPLTDEQADAFGRAEVLLTLDLPLDLSSLAPNLRWVQSISSGVAQYRAARLDEGEIVLTNAAGVGAPPIAEWVLGRALQMVKRFPAHDANTARRAWEPEPGAMLEGMTMAIVGLGAIGRGVAVRARAFGVHVVGLRRSAAPGDRDPDVDELAPADTLAEVVARSDIVVVCAAGSSANRDMFDASMFAAMRPGSWFVNVSRGDLVVEAALIEALESGHLAGAAIDVARTEPLPSDDPLWGAPNLLVSPHISTAGANYRRRVVELFVRNFERYVAGEPLDNVIDLATL